MIDLSFIWLGSSIGYCIRLLLTDYIKNETSVRIHLCGQKFRFLNNGRAEYYPSNSFTLAEMARPSALPASFLVATPMTLPIS